MNLSDILAILNSGIPSEALGGLTSHAIINLIQKIKSHFGKNEVITEQKISEKIKYDKKFSDNYNTLRELLCNSDGLLMIGDKNVKVDNNFGTINL